MSVCNITLPANYFHLLRRQLKRTFRKPLIVFTPKKLLRLKQARSTIDEFIGETRFQPLLDEAYPEEIVAPEKVKRVVFCSGQVYYDLLNYRRQNEIKDVAIVRLEELSPFPHNPVRTQLNLYKNAEAVWSQEEQRNMGPWNYVKSKFNYYLL